MDLVRMSSLGALVPEGPWYVFYTTRYQVYWGLTCNVVFYWYSDLILHTHTHTHTNTCRAHSGASRLTHPCKYKFTPPVMCSSYLYYIKWNHSLISKIYFPVSFLFKNYSLVKVIYLLIRCYKTGFLLWNTDNTDRNGVNKQNTCTNQTLRERYRKGLLLK